MEAERRPNRQRNDKTKVTPDLMEGLGKRLPRENAAADTALAKRGGHDPLAEAGNRPKPSRQRTKA